jgi:hypothetical protein
MTRRFVPLLLIAACGTSLRAQDVPPPPKPDNGPSLEATMKYIEGSLVGAAGLSWVSTLHDSVAQNSGVSEKWFQAISSVQTTASSCSIRLRRRVSSNPPVLRHLWWIYKFDPLGRQRRDWILTDSAHWVERNEDGSTVGFTVDRAGSLDGVSGTFAKRDDQTLDAFIPDRSQTGVKSRWLMIRFGKDPAWKLLGVFAEDSRRVDDDLSLSLSEVRSISVLSLDRWQDTSWAEQNLPETKETIADPIPFVAVYMLNNGGKRPIFFTTEEAANRFAKALVHAVELCGGGDKDPFK